MATTTFLFVDQVGSTEQLTALGDSGAHTHRTALMASLRDAVASHGGEEVDAAGDGLFAAFRSAADAVEAAARMQQAVEVLGRVSTDGHRSHVRAGLHAGEPLTNPDGSYFGTAVVVASRLCSRAGAGQVLVSDLVRSLVEPRGDHVFTSAGTLELKGVPAPVAASLLHWEPLDTTSRLPAELTAVEGEPPWAGRAREREQLLAALADVSGAAPARRLVLLTGDHGAGTTRTAAELARSAAAAGAVVWYGRPSGSGELSAWVSAVESWQAGAPRAVVQWALGPQWGGPTTGSLDVALARLSSAAPVVVVLDDLHDADDATLAVLDRLARSPRPARLLLLACCATSPVGAPRVVRLAQAVPGSREVVLRGLARVEVASLVTALTGAEQPEATVAAVLAESDGLPAFVCRMAIAHRERAVLDEVGHAVQLAEELRGDLALRREEITLGLRELEQLRERSTGERTAPVEPDGTPPADVPCPYRGLLPYGSDQADDLAGREQLVAELLGRLAVSRFLAVVGASGSGKSSAVHAGLLPALARGDLPGSETWRPCACVPGADPLGALATAVAGLSVSATPHTTRTLLAAHALSEVVSATAPGPPVVLVVDQAEELWTAGSPGRDRVLDLLAAAGDDVVVVVVLRADYYGRVAEHPAFAASCADSQVLVGPLRDGEVRAVVEVPARRAGLLLEPGLAQAVLDDVASAPGALPLVSTAMLETWQRRRGRSLTLAGYAEAGGVRGAISTLAETTFAALGDADRDLVRRLLLRLAAPGSDGDDVARRAPLAEVAGDEGSRRVLEHLVAARLVVTGAETAGVAHEALLREWPRLREWLDADRAGRRLHQQLSSAATDWDRDGRPADALLRGSRLALAAEWASEHASDLSATERDLLAASTAHRDHELVAARSSARRLRALAGGLAAVLVLALAVGGFALQQRAAAADRARVAEARGLASRAVALAPTQLDRALLLAVEAYRLDPSQQTSDGLATVLDRAGPLQEFADASPGDRVIDVVVTPDGRLAHVVGPHDLTSYDASTWQPVGNPLLEELQQPFALSSSLDGRWLFTGDSRGLWRVDTTTGTSSGPFDAGSGSYPQGAASGDGEVFAAATFFDPVVRVYDSASGEEVASFDTGMVAPGLAPLPGRSGFLLWDYQGADGAVRRINFQGRDEQAALSTPFTAVDVVSAAPDGSALLVATGASAVVLDLETGQPRAPAEALPGARAFSADWSPDSTAVAVGTDGGAALVLDGGGNPAELSGRTGSVIVQFTSPTELVVVPPTGPPTSYDLSEVNPLAQSLLSGGGSLTGVVAAADGELVAVDVSSLLRLPLSGGDATPLLEVPDAFLGTAESAPAGATAAVSGVVGTTSDDGLTVTDLRELLLLVDTTTGDVRWEQRTPAPSGAGGGDGLSFSPDGEWLARIDGAAVVTVVDVATGSQRWPGVAVDDYAGGAIAWSRDGRHVLAGGQSGVLSVLDSSTGAVLRTAQLTDTFQLSDAEPVAETDLVAVAAESGQVFLVDGTTGAPIGAPLSASGVQLRAVAVSPSGERIAAVARGGSVAVWDRRTRRLLLPTVSGHRGDASDVQFVGEEAVVTTGFDGRLLRWDLSPDPWVERACTLAGRELTAAEWAEDLPGRDQAPTCA